MAEEKGTTAQVLTGVVDRVTYHNEENGYSVLRLNVAGMSDPVTVLGNFSTVSPGEQLRLTGWWTTHPKYGDQFRSNSYEILRPATIAGIQKYLGSGLIKGVGPVTARRIVDHFGEQTLDIIENDISRLGEVRGIARKRVELIERAWAEQQSIKQVMLFLQSHGVSTHFAVKIFKQYGQEAIAIVEQNPYRLAVEVYGIGFRTADQIARNLGLPIDAPARLEAGLRFVLSAAADEGHCYLPQRELLERAAQILELEAPAMVAALSAVSARMLTLGELRSTPRAEDHAIYLPAFWQAESGIARRLRLLLEQPLAVDLPRIGQWLDRYTGHHQLELSTEQRAGIIEAAARRVLILTGGPGTGKTTTLRAMVQLFLAMGLRVALGSPTGRAAQRLAEVTGREAKTIHRLLEFDPSQMAFRRDDQNPLDADVVIIDEASMIDLLLANSLFKAIAPTARLILVGDVDQLPSVGPGKVLQDLIRCGEIPVARLTQVFRQAAESLIIQNAHAINRGEFPRLVAPGAEKCDCYFIESEDSAGIVSLIVKAVVTSLPNRFGFDPRRDIQVLAPMNRGQVGANSLNATLQQALNPPIIGQPELVRANRDLRVGDRVIQRVNNYKLEVFNGDMGTIEAMDLEDQLVAIRFGDRLVAYDYADLMELAHGYCVTVHKSQGSEYPAVVLPLHTSHFLMLSRNLLYTALTRARRTVVIIGSTRAIAIAMNSTEAMIRYTGLTEALSDRSFPQPGLIN
ncbi:MAG: ATP-dependent RecD-like DNA helicase [Blastocatellia bacterium]